MKELIQDFATKELESLNEIMDKVLQIPLKAFKEFGSCGISIPVMEYEKSKGNFDFDPAIVNGEYQLDRLYAETPHVPREAVLSFSIAYMCLVSIFFDERFKNPRLNEIDALETLMLLREKRGYVLGLVTGSANSDSRAVQEARSMLAKNAAAMRHAENHAFKADVFDWLDANFSNCKSLDSAAEDMAGKLVPCTFRTVRGWATEWKKLRSASTP